MEASPGGESSDNSYMSADEAPQAAKAKEVPACNGHAEEVSTTNYKQVTNTCCSLCLIQIVVVAVADEVFAEDTF